MLPASSYAVVCTQLLVVDPGAPWAMSMSLGLVLAIGMMRARAGGWQAMESTLPTFLLAARVSVPNVTTP
ncbi:MAG: hypothetical protein H6836_10145 [Planctomycetes bacterium]|nr:hypothetical protein [Planctomycetota bacterium]MCB9889921.1 hypothetical protein [Planctomycetota bacterium]